MYHRGSKTRISQTVIAKRNSHTSTCTPVFTLLTDKMYPPPLTVSFLGVVSVAFFLGALSLWLPLLHVSQAQWQGLRVSTVSSSHVHSNAQPSSQLFHEASSPEAIADPLPTEAGKIHDVANREPGLDGRSCYLSWDGEPQNLTTKTMPETTTSTSNILARAIQRTRIVTCLRRDGRPVLTGSSCAMAARIERIRQKGSCVTSGVWRN